MHSGIVNIGLVIVLCIVAFDCALPICVFCFLVSRDSVKTLYRGWVFQDLLTTISLILEWILDC